MAAVSAPASQVPAEAREALRELMIAAGAGKRVCPQSIERLHRAHPDWFPPLQLMLEQALNDGDAGVVAACLRDIEDRWVEASPERCWTRATIHKDRGEMAAGVEAALEGLRIPSRNVGLTRSLLVAVKEIGGRDALCRAPLPPDIERIPPASLEFLASGLEHLGDLERAVAIRRIAAGQGPAQVDGAMAGAESAWSQDLVGVESPGSDVGVVLFTGLMHEAGVRIEVLKDELGAFPFHFIALRDTNRLTFLGGHRALGHDPAVAAANLRARLDAMGVRKTIVVGNSAGCVGALLYGALLQADAIVCYAPIASISASFEYRGRAVLRRMNSLVSAEWLRPPVERLRECASAIPIQVNYGDLMDVDSRHAEEIATLPMVELAPVDGFDSHDVIRELIARGELRSRFEGFIGPVLGTA